MSKRIKKENIDSISNKVSNEIQKLIAKNRIISIILYGSSLSISKYNPVDLDILILLDSYKPEDLMVINSLSKKYPVEIFIDYKDQVERKGVNFYQRGRHGTYFILSLANAKLLYGFNYYKRISSDITFSIVQRDLFYRIEEYFYRIQKMIMKDKDNFIMIEKYISRICMDLLLITEDLKFESVHIIHYKDIINKLLPKSTIFSSDLISKINVYLSTKDTHSLLIIIGEMHNEYLNIFDNWKKKVII